MKKQRMILAVLTILMIGGLLGAGFVPARLRKPVNCQSR